MRSCARAQAARDHIPTDWARNDETSRAPAGLAMRVCAPIPRAYPQGYEGRSLVGVRPINNWPWDGTWLPPTLPLPAPPPAKNKPRKGKGKSVEPGAVSGAPTIEPSTRGKTLRSRNQAAPVSAASDTMKRKHSLTTAGTSPPRIERARALSLSLAHTREQSFTLICAPCVGAAQA